MKKQIILPIVTALTGVLIGFLIFGTDSGVETTKTTEKKDKIWTCSMHPQIRQNEPGDCPICGMDLIPLASEQGEEQGPMAISMSQTAMQLAQVQSMVVGKNDALKSIRLNGKVETDERLLFTQASHIPGRIEKLEVNFTG